MWNGVPLKIYMLKFYPPDDGISSWGLREVLSHESGILTKGISALK